MSENEKHALVKHLGRMINQIAQEIAKRRKEFNESSQNRLPEYNKQYEKWRREMNGKIKDLQAQRNLLTA